MAQTIDGALFSECTSQPTPHYFNGKYLSHQKIRMKNFLKSNDVKVQRVIKLCDLPLVSIRKDGKQSDDSQTPTRKNSILEDNTDEQIEVI